MPLVLISVTLICNTITFAPPFGHNESRTHFPLNEMQGAFANAHLWVTLFEEEERYPAGEYTPQSLQQDGLPKWIEGDRNVAGENIVLWHCKPFV